MNLEFALTTGDPCPIAFKRVTTTPKDFGAAVGSAISEVASALSAMGIELAGSPFTRISSFTDEQIQFDAGLTLDSELADARDLLLGSLPGGDAASATYQGDFDGLWAARVALHDWVRGLGRQPIEGGWEVYVVDEILAAAGLAACELFVTVS